MKTTKQLVATLEELGGKMTAEEDIKFQGTQIVLPAGSNLHDNIVFLQKKEQEDERPMEFSRQYRYRPWDGAYATANALRKAFGMVSSTPILSLFGSMPPSMVTIPTGVGTTTQVL